MLQTAFAGDCKKKLSGGWFGAIFLKEHQKKRRYDWSERATYIFQETKDRIRIALSMFFEIAIKSHHKKRKK